MKNQGERAALTATVGLLTTASPADFPLGSIESRAAARQRADALEPPTHFFCYDDDGNLLFEARKRYKPPFFLFPLKISMEESERRYTPRLDPTAERERQVENERCEERRRVNLDIGMRELHELVQEMDVVPGSVAIARIPRQPRGSG